MKSCLIGFTPIVIILEVVAAISHDDATWGTNIMPGRGRDNRERLPEFYLSPSVNGLRIDPQVRSAMEQLWPWFWTYVGVQLSDPGRAGDLADEVAFRVSSYLETHCQVRSLVGLCRAAAMHFVVSTRARERRIEYRGLSQEIEGSLGVSTPDWQEERRILGLGRSGITGPRPRDPDNATTPPP